MNSDRTAIFGGLIILIGGLALAIYANTNATALTQTKAKAVEKYISLSEKALSEGENRDAEKFAVKAIKADPSNKSAITAFKKVALAGYKPVAETDNKATQENTPKAESDAKKPEPEEDAEEEMGCI